MKEYGKKISRYLMKNKKGRFYCVAGVLYLLAILFVMNDAWLYQTPIVKVTKVVTIVEGKSKSTRGTEETKYKQSLYGKIINGEDKGKEVRIANEYTTTEMVDQKYHKGDRVFYKGSSIIGVKRDTMLVVMLGFLALLLLGIAGRQGGLTIITAMMNILIFVIGFWTADDTSEILSVCSRLILFFAVVTLVGLNGIHRKTFAALLTTLCVLLMIMGIFDLVMQHMEELDYSTMEYLSGLGAIMDVAVAISVALSEIVEQKPEVKFVELFRSGREIGYDIMGTMINVLLFVFGCGLIPACLIRMNNEVRFVTIVKLHIPCELCRFFVESIGIVLAIPVSIFITAVMMKLSVKKREKRC